MDCGPDAPAAGDQTRRGRPLTVVGDGHYSPGRRAGTPRARCERRGTPVPSPSFPRGRSPMKSRATLLLSALMLAGLATTGRAQIKLEPKYQENTKVTSETNVKTHQILTPNDMDI